MRICLFVFAYVTNFGTIEHTFHFLNIFVCNHFLVTIILFAYFLIDEIYVLIIDVYFIIMRKKERNRQKEGEREKGEKKRRKKRVRKKRKGGN